MADVICEIRELLRQGFGVDDIALKLNVPVEVIRLAVRGWQKTGAIKAILKNGKGDTPDRERVAYVKPI